MSRDRKNIEFDQSVEEKEKSFSFRDLVDGNVLTRKAVIKQSRFILLLVLIAFLSIANRNHAEKTVIRLNQLQSDVKEMRAKSISTSSELVRISRQSEVKQLVNRYGLSLEENLEPPKQLIETEE
ncbi:MAG: FtsL-like putative cell division protein [Bacteroidales bacterium]|nr:FtsL-like putative cell division protein [Bacteroidales bacterium]